MKHLRQLALFLFISAPSITIAGDIPTRYGSLQINEDKVLFFDGLLVKPGVQGNNSLDLIGVYKVGSSDVALIQDTGGSACPAQYYLITVSKTGATASPAFGSCTDLIKVHHSRSTITISMHGYVGPQEPESSQNKALKERFVYLYRNGIITENGHPIK